MFTNVFLGSLITLCLVYLLGQGERGSVQEKFLSVVLLVWITSLMVFSIVELTMRFT